eukprot:CAMPEP_0197536428 /NCGR_PEP_ID=MMETSP1318-20131121/53833_1 /TAXON_ID=552666 /ORGANISM="Partenskyella glossopodia, Strain RCC365" /LENGTH=52 /DNA_ID=CAMNT_0043094315 /DNA_START=77 /DNA_END=235 /DNA_ORIENTATION=+
MAASALPTIGAVKSTQMSWVPSVNPLDTTGAKDRAGLSVLNVKGNATSLDAT